MRRLRRPPVRRFVTLAVLAAALGAPGPATAARLPEVIVQDDAVLLHRPEAQVAASMDRLAQLGVDRVRLTANWSTLTRNGDARTAPVGFDASDPAAYEQARWAGLDRAVRLARTRGLKVLLDVGFWAPVWATTDAEGPRARTNIDAAAYRAFAVAVTRRYDGHFVPPPDSGQPSPPTADDTLLNTIFGPLAGGLGPGSTTNVPDVRPTGTPLPTVDEAALWNEPNHPGLLLPQWRTPTSAPVSPEIYRRMVLAAYPAMKAIRPHLRILVGNASSLGGAPGTGTGPVAPLRFLRQLACVDARLRPITTGACATFTRLPGDGWAQHPYTAGQSPIRRSAGNRPDDIRIGDLPRLSRLLDRLAALGRIAPGMRNIYLTEFGYETHDIGSRKGLSQRTQAHWLTWAEYRATRLPRVRATAQFLIGDQLPAATRVSDSSARPFGQFYTGLYDGQGRPKLAARAFTVGLFAQRRTGGRTLLWVRLRGGGGPRRVTVQRRVGGGRWVSVATTPSALSAGAGAWTFTAGARSASTRYARRADGPYRVRVSGRGAPVTGLPTVVEPPTDTSVG
jgi:hypothetical protein